MIALAISCRSLNTSLIIQNLQFTSAATMVGREKFLNSKHSRMATVTLYTQLVDLCNKISYSFGNPKNSSIV